MSGGKLPRVDIIFAYAGVDRALIDAACAAAAKQGVAIVRVSRTGGGVVERNIEIDDDRLGFVAADELNPKKARVFLMLGLTRTDDPRARCRNFSSPAKTFLPSPAAESPSARSRSASL